MTINREYPCNPTNYSPGRSKKIDYLVIHYVGATGGAKANAKYYGSSAVGASAHYFVGHASENTAVFGSVDEADTAWHCGRSDGKYKHPTCRNANSIGIEMCCHQTASGLWYFDPETVDRTVELARDIMTRHGIPIANVVRHYDVTGKLCPRPYVDNEAAWSAFKLRLTESEEDDMDQSKFNELFDTRMTELAEQGCPDWAQAELQEAIALGITDGTRPCALIPRYQAAIMAKRAAEVAKK